MGYDDRCEISVLLGQTLERIDRQGDDELIFHVASGGKYRMYHSQNCCESVTIDDVCGDLTDLTGSPITQAEEITSDTNPNGVPVPEYQESFTWTFYKLATINGSVTIRWYGSSNGFYSESVDFEKIET